MKTPPIQQKQAAAPQQDTQTNDAEGKSIAPPAFQLKAAAASGPASGSTIQRAAEVLTILKTDADLRGGAPDYKTTGKLIPKGTRVEVLETQVVGAKTYIRVKDHDTGTELGWTSKLNTTDNYGKEYAPAKASYVYHIAGKDVLVFVPSGVEKKSSVDVFMFFHGWGGNYKSPNVHTDDGSRSVYDDNPAISGKMPDAVANYGGIAICPQANNWKSEADWKAMKAGAYKAMVDTTLLRLSTDLGRSDKPLSAGNVSLAGHSAGGAALGQGAKDMEATDVTLQDAGYGWEDSWTKLRDWFLTGNAPKTMRVITQSEDKKDKTDDGRKTATRTLVREGSGKFAEKVIEKYAQELISKNTIKGPVKVEPIPVDPKDNAGGISMERGYRVFLDGKLQGSLRLYEMASHADDHWDVAAKTMAPSMKYGATDRASDAAAVKK